MRVREMHCVKCSGMRSYSNICTTARLNAIGMPLVVRRMTATPYSPPARLGAAMLVLNKYMAHTSAAAVGHILEHAARCIQHRQLQGVHHWVLLVYVACCVYARVLFVLQILQLAVTAQCAAKCLYRR